MKKKKMKTAGKCMAAGAVALTILFSGNLYNTEIYAAEAEHAVVENAKSNYLGTLSAKYAWYYKIVDGVKLTRLRDESNGKWLTPWLICP